MSLKKYLPYAIFTLLLIFFPISAFADLVPMECMQLGKELPRYCMYGNYKGPLYPEIMRINPLIDLFANFSLVFIATSVLAFLIKKRLSIRTILYTVALTAVGLVVDSIALYISRSVHDYYYQQYIYDTSFLRNIFLTALFISSFILLVITYFFSYKYIFKSRFVFILIVSLFLAVINNPFWYLWYLRYI